MRDLFDKIRVAYAPSSIGAYEAAKISIGSGIGINGILRELSYILKDLREAIATLAKNWSN